MAARGSWVNLNLTAKYAPAFNADGNWPVFREVVCNAIDADPKGFRVRGDANVLEVTTNTAPTIEQVLVIGEGTKAPGGDTIGQFGEGLKIAANATIRANGRMFVRLPTHTITYGYRVPKGYQTPTLHAMVKEELNGPGCLVRIELDRVGTHAHKILLTRDSQLIERKPDETHLRLYCKGVWVRDLEEKSLYHYSIQTGSINRDRGVVDMHDMKCHAGFLLLNRLNENLAKTLLTEKESCKFEHDIMEYVNCNATKRHREIFAAAFRRLNGPLAVVAGEEDKVNQKATFIGHTAVKVPRGFERYLVGEGSNVKMAIDVLPKHHELEFVPICPTWKWKVAKLTHLVEVLGVPGFKLEVFAPHEKILGIFLPPNEERKCAVIGLNQKLFEDGQERELYSTFCHECAHAKEFCSDGTFEFEASLSRVCGVLSEALLDGWEPQEDGVEVP